MLTFGKLQCDRFSCCWKANKPILTSFSFRHNVIHALMPWSFISSLFVNSMLTAVCESKLNIAFLGRLIWRMQAEQSPTSKSPSSHMAADTETQKSPKKSFLKCAHTGMLYCWDLLLGPNSGFECLYMRAVYLWTAKALGFVWSGHLVY